jgi:hypothetical protein
VLAKNGYTSRPENRRSAVSGPADYTARRRRRGFPSATLSDAESFAVVLMSGTGVLIMVGNRIFAKPFEMDDLALQTHWRDPLVRHHQKLLRLAAPPGHVAGPGHPRQLEGLGTAMSSIERSGTLRTNPPDGLPLLAPSEQDLEPKGRGS